MAYVKENKEQLGKFFVRMANQIAGELPEGWTHFVVGFFVNTSGGEDLLVYVTEDEGVSWHDFMDDVFNADEIITGAFECKETCQALRAECARTGDRWSNFTLIVEAGGRFSAEFKYEPFEELTPVLKSMWMGEYLE